MKRNDMRRTICLALLFALLLSGCRAWSRSNSAASGRQTEHNAPSGTVEPTPDPTTEPGPTEETAEKETAPVEPAPSSETAPEPIPFTGQEVKSIPFVAQYVRTDHYAETVEFPRSRIVCSREELIAFYNEFLNAGDAASSFAPAAATGIPTEFEKYDEDFFLDHSLIVVQLEEGSGTNRHQVTAVWQNSGAYRVHLDRMVPGPGYAGTCDMAEWHVLIEIPKVDASVRSDAVDLQITTKEMGG